MDMDLPEAEHGTNAVCDSCDSCDYESDVVYDAAAHGYANEGHIMTVKVI